MRKPTSERSGRATKSAKTEKRPAKGKSTRALGLDAESAALPAPTTAEPGADGTGIEAEIRIRAHEIYLSRGAFDGNHLDDWFEAERQVRLQRGPANPR